MVGEQRCLPEEEGERGERPQEQPHEVSLAPSCSVDEQSQGAGEHQPTDDVPISAQMLRRCG